VEGARDSMKALAVGELAMQVDLDEEGKEQEDNATATKKASEKEGGEGMGEVQMGVLEMVKGMRLFMDKEEGNLKVKGVSLHEGDEVVSVKEWLQDTQGEDIEVVEEQVLGDGVGEGDRSVDTLFSGGLDNDMLGFLDCIESGGKDEDAERKRGEDKKRRRDEGGFKVNNRGLLGTFGWEEKERREKGDVRWERKVSRGEEVVKEDMPLPKEYRLGLEKRGEELHSSARGRNSMGTGRSAIFPKGGMERGEDRNWIASFTKAGCISCKGESGELNHKGRRNEPIVLVVGDEAVPMGVGYTKGGDEDLGCAWIFKKEHLRLGEVAGILNRINKDKQENDKESGRRPHEFFLPNGSKILVSSYVHLRKEGLQGYMEDFASMVKEVWAVTGDCGVEVLPVVPVVFPGLDKEGGRLISGVRKWISWMSQEAGRVELLHLSGTGGREEGEEAGGPVFVRPTGLLLRNQRKESKELGQRGNVLSLVKGTVA